MNRLVRGTSWDDRGAELKEDLMRGMEERCAEKCEDVGFRLTCDVMDGSLFSACGGSPTPRKHHETTSEK